MLEKMKGEVLQGGIEGILTNILLRKLLKRGGSG